MPSIVRTTIGDIAMWVRQGPQAAWDVGTSQAVITGDEYGLQPFLHSPLRHEVRTVVDIGANIGAFTLAARRMFPNARVIAVEPDPENNELLRRNCGDDSQVTICRTAVLNDGCPSTVHLCRHELNSGGSYVRELFEQKSAPFTDLARRQGLGISPRRLRPSPGEAAPRWDVCGESLRDARQAAIKAAAWQVARVGISIPALKVPPTFTADSGAGLAADYREIG